MARGFEGDWSPDGTQIVFKYHAPGLDHNELRVMDADGTNVRTIWVGGPGQTAETPDWGLIEIGTDQMGRLAILVEYGQAGRIAAEGQMQVGLVERAREGDHDAFAALAAAALGRLDGAARLILRDPDQAKDAVQNALVRAWRDLPTLRDPERFDAWLHRL